MKGGVAPLKTRAAEEQGQPNWDKVDKATVRRIFVSTNRKDALRGAKARHMREMRWCRLRIHRWQSGCKSVCNNPHMAIFAPHARTKNLRRSDARSKPAYNAKKRRSQPEATQ